MHVIEGISLAYETIWGAGGRSRSLVVRGLLSVILSLQPKFLNRVVRSCVDL